MPGANLAVIFCPSGNPSRLRHERRTGRFADCDFAALLLPHVVKAAVRKLDHQKVGKYSLNLLNWPDYSFNMPPEDLDHFQLRP
jgi:hypothetical protein